MNTTVKSNVKLIAHTQPVQELDMLKDLKDLIAYMARISNPNNQDNVETGERLVKFLIREKHWSPLEMVNVVLEVETPRDIARQLLRHRSFSFQEFSQRYANPLEDLKQEILRESRLQDHKNRQNSLENDDVNLDLAWKGMQNSVKQSALAAYEWAINKGIAKEVARTVLPEGLTMSRLYVNGTLRSWIHYLQVRLDPSTQKEHRELALAIKTQIVALYPGLEDYFKTFETN